MASNGMGLSSHGIVLKLDEQSGSHISLAIRFNAHGKTYVIDTSDQRTIRDVKLLVSEKAGLVHNTISLVLAGKQLKDDAVLQNCGIGPNTTLHAFSQPISTNNRTDIDRSGTRSNSICEMTSNESRDANFSRNFNQNIEPSPLLNRGWEGSSVDGDVVSQISIARNQVENNSPAYNRFFVYCKLCEGIRPAKLRLVCKECGNGAFLVERGPENWNDISFATQITGKCTSENCSCTTPRFFLRCCEPHIGDVDGTAVLLKHVNTNRRRVECIACGDIATHVLIFPCVPGHVTCLPCFRQYCSVCLSERSFTEHERYGYTLPCPAGCPNSLIEESHHFLLMGKEQYERYKNFGAEEFVLQNGGMLCPARGCGMGLFPEDNNRLVKCGECQFESCRDCRREYHRGPCYILDSVASPQDMGITAEMAERASWERQSLCLIEETTKACPTCHTKTERSGGCMHMVCSRCAAEWCWICVKPWSRECMAQHWFG